MVFSSLPAYLDPSNWHQHQLQLQQQQQQQQEDQDPNDQHNHQQNYHQGGAVNFTNPLLPPPPLPPPPPTPQQLIAPHHLSHQQQQQQQHQHAVRPRSMAERARMANIPMPEASLKCPRCDSTNTKFCYFNNYSLSQPRHFCKACRRYWTRGGALRSVPVGGGCRRNKRSKSSSTTGGTGSKSSPGPSTSERSTGSTSVARSSSSGVNMAADIDLDLTHLPPMSIPMPMPMSMPMPSQQLRFMSMSPLHQYFSSSSGTTTGGGIGDHFGDHQLLSAPLSSINNNHDPAMMAGNIHQLGGIINGGSSTGSEQWRMQPPQFPFLGGAAPAGLMTDSHSPTNNSLLYPFEGSSPHQHHHRVQLSRFGVGAAFTTTNTTKINSSPDHHQGPSSSTAKMETTTPPHRHQYQEMSLSTQFNLGGLLSGQYGHTQSHATNLATSACVAGDHAHTTTVSAAPADHEFSSNSWGASPDGNNVAPNAWTNTTTT